MTVVEIGFDVGFVRFLADGFDVDAEQDIAHRGVPDGDEFDDLASSDLKGADHLADFVVDGRDEDGLEFASVGSGLV